MWHEKEVRLSITKTLHKTTPQKILPHPHFLLFNKLSLGLSNENHLAKLLTTLNTCHQPTSGDSL